MYMSGVNTLKTSEFELCTLKNSEDLGKMLHNAAFYKGLHLLLIHSRSQEEINFLFRAYNL